MSGPFYYTKLEATGDAEALQELDVLLTPVDEFGTLEGLHNLIPEPAWLKHTRMLFEMFCGPGGQEIRAAYEAQGVRALYDETPLKPDFEELSKARLPYWTEDSPTRRPVTPAEWDILKSIGASDRSGFNWATYHWDCREGVELQEKGFQDDGKKLVAQWTTERGWAIPLCRALRDKFNGRLKLTFRSVTYKDEACTKLVPMPRV